MEETEKKAPDVSILTKVYYADDKSGTNKKQVAYVKEIPQLEEAPEQITDSVLDLDYEIAQPGIKKAGTIELPLLFTHTQHKELRALKGKSKYWFFEAPANTAATDGKPLVRFLKGKSCLTMDTVAVGEFMKDKLTIYKESDVEESDGFPTAQ